MLEQKLMEFHGEFEEVHLPSKKSFGTKNRNFMESKQIIIEKYLQVCLCLISDIANMSDIIQNR